MRGRPVASPGSVSTTQCTSPVRVAWLGPGFLHAMLATRTGLATKRSSSPRGVAGVALLGVSLYFLAIGVSACTDPFKDKPLAQVGNPVDTALLDSPLVGDSIWVLDPSKSTLRFVAAKPTALRDGSFDLDSGSVWLRDGSAVFLDVEIAVHSLKAEPNSLREHLLGEDFFDVARFPRATLQANLSLSAGERDGELDGVLELHGVRKSIKAPFSVATESAGVLIGRSEFLLPRHEFGIRYQGSADDLIRAEVLLQIELYFVAPS